MQVKSSHNNSRRMDLAQNPDDSQLHLLQEQCPCAVAFLGGLRAHHTISSDQSCEPFCADNGCPCLLPWAKRCELNSCSTCNECGAVRCSCTGLGNEYSCDDNTRGYCSSSGACLNTGTFMKGDWSAGCGSPTTTTPPTTTTTTTPPPPPECQCSLPGKAADYNCNDQTSGHCTYSAWYCYGTGKFLKGDAASACKPTCSCTSSAGYRCSDGATGWCSSGLTCFNTDNWDKRELSEGCR